MQKALAVIGLSLLALPLHLALGQVLRTHSPVSTMYQASPRPAGAASNQPGNVKLHNSLSILDFGGVGDMESITDGVTTSRSAIFTSASSNFNSAAAGKTIVIQGVGNSSGALVGFKVTIRSVVSSTQVILSAPVPTSATSVTAQWGTDSTAALNAGLTAISSSATPQCLSIPSGSYLITSTINMESYASVCADPQAMINFDTGASASSNHTGIEWIGGGRPFLSPWVDCPTCHAAQTPPLAAMFQIRPATAGSTTLICLTAGCWKGFIAVGQWLWIAEGSDPSHTCANNSPCLYDNVRQFGRVVSVSGDVLTLDRPLEFNFNGSTAALWPLNPTYDGVFRMNMVKEAWWHGGKIFWRHADKIGLLSTSGAEKGGFTDAIVTPVMDAGATRPYNAQGYFSNSIYFSMLNTVWTFGHPHGCSLDQYCTIKGNFFENIDNTEAIELGQATSFATYQDNKFMNVQYMLIYIEPSTSYTHFLNNSVTTTGRGTAVEDLGGQGDIIQDNYFISPNGGAIGVGTENNFIPYHYSSDVAVLDNTIVTQGSNTSCILVANYPGAVNLTIKGNHCTNPLDDGITTRGGNAYFGYFHGLTVADNNVNATNGGQYTSWPFGYGNAVRFAWTAPSNGIGDFQAGDIILVRNPTAEFGRASGLETVGEYVTKPGTLDTALRDITAATTKGSTAVMFNSVKGLHVGGWITIAGVRGPLFQLLSLTGNSGVLNFKATATASAGAVAWEVPAFAPIMPVDTRAYRSAASASLDKSLDYFVDLTGTGTTSNLPSASAMNGAPDSVGKQYILRNKTGTANLIAASEGTTINGLDNITLPNSHDFVILHWDGKNWDVIGGSPAVMEQLGLTSSSAVSVTIGTTTVHAASCTSGSTASFPGLMPTVPHISIAAWSIKSGVATFRAANTLVAGQSLILSGFGTSTFFNGQHVNVIASGLSGSQFSVNFNHANSSATESGSALWQGNAIFWSPNGDVSNVSGWSPAGPTLNFDAWATPNALHYKVCNGSATNITPGTTTLWNIGAR